MAASPQYAGTPKVAIAQVTTANTARDGSGTPITIYTAGASGSRIENIVIKAVSSTSEGTVRFFIHDGANARILTEVGITTVIPSATIPSFETEVVFENPILLPNGYSLRATTEKTETFNIFAFGGDF